MAHKPGHKTNSVNEEIKKAAKKWLSPLGEKTSGLSRAEQLKKIRDETGI